MPRKHTRGTTLEALAGKAFSRVTDANRSDGNAVRLLRDGEQNYPAWLEAIAGARQHIHLENYILENDKIGRGFAEALIGAAKRGVAVRVLYDWFGCRSRTPRRFWRRLRRAGVEVRSYNPPRWDSPLGWISRDHRKTLCVDATVAFTGGLCIGHDWVGNPKRNVRAWRDTGIEVRGPGVHDLETAFADSWAATGTPVPALELPKEEDIPRAGELGLWVVAGRPESRGLYRLEQLVADSAEESLWIADAYFVATSGYVRALSGAVRDGVDVRLLVPGSNNFPVVQALSRAGYRPLLEAGVRVFEWNGPMMHAKTAVADGCWARVGSSNSNLASWISNRELDVVIQDVDFAEQMEAMFEQDLTDATEIVLSANRVRASAKVRRRRRRGSRTGSAGRFVAGAAGLGSAVGAVLSQHRALGHTEARVLVAIGVFLTALALCGVLAPGLLAYPAAFLAAWIAGTLFFRAWKLHASADNPRRRRK